MVYRSFGRSARDKRADGGKDGGGGRRGASASAFCLHSSRSKINSRPHALYIFFCSRCESSRARVLVYMALKMSLLSSRALVSKIEGRTAVIFRGDRGRRAKCNVVAPEINKGKGSRHSAAARREIILDLLLRSDDLTEIIVSEVTDNRGGIFESEVSG